ncbi:MAG: ABC transporter permease [Armatimonadota bacterium]
MRPVLQVAKYTVHEALRRRFMNVILLFGIVVIASSSMFAAWAPGAELKMIVDTSLGAIRIFGMLMAVFLGAILIPTEIEKKTIHVLLAKPVSRMQFLIGKFLGAYFTVLINIVLMGGAFLAVMYKKQGSFAGERAMDFLYPNLVWALVLMLFELLILTGIAVTVSTIASWVFTAIFSFFVYFTAQLRSTLGHLAEPGSYDNPISQGVLSVLRVALPHFDNFDVRQAIIAGTPVVPKYVGECVLHAFLYTAILLVLGYIFFHEREV